MKRLLALSLLTVALAACGQSGTTAPPSNLTVSAGNAVEAGLALPFAGTWEVEELPAWLKVSPMSGSGNVRLTLRLTRPALSDARLLAGQFKLRFTRGVREGVSTVSVTANAYRVAGRLGNVVNAAANVAPVETLRAPRVVKAGRARGVLVKYKSPEGLLRAQRAGAGVQSAAARVAVLATNDVNATLARLRADSDVEYAVPNVVLSALGREALVPQDQFAPLQWTYPLLGYGAVWRDMQEAPYQNSVTVAVLDGGVRFDHPDLKGALWGPGEGALDLVPRPQGGLGDEYGLDEDPTDPSVPGRTLGSHGTHVAGIIAARWGKFSPPCLACSDSGVVGAAMSAPVKVLPVRVLDASGNGDLATIAAGVRYAAGLPVSMNGREYVTPHKAQVINLSLGGPIKASEAKPLCDAVTDAKNAGALVVAAGGNNGDDSLFYPAACEGAVAVASVSLSDGAPVRAYYSNANASIALAAPGGDDRQALNGGVLEGDAFPDAVFSTSWNYPDNRPNYEAMVGTSQAAPQVSALAALLLSKGVVTSAQDALTRMRQTASDLGPAGRDDAFGAGLINAAKALNAGEVELPLRVLARRLVNGKPQSVALRVDALGRFEGFVREGEYRLLARREGAAGATTQQRAEVPFTLGPDSPERDLGTLILK